MTLVRKSLLLVIVALLVLLVAAGAALAAKPTKVIIVTMDQMKPGYAKQFNMKNILWLQGHGVAFKNATVGQMASETVVSHNTIVSGQLPKHMGWSDEVMRDAKDVLGYGAGAIITVGDLDYDQYTQLIEAEGYPKLGDYMHKKFPGEIVANFGGKYYQAASTAASSSDIWVTYGSKLDTADLPDPTVVPWVGKYRGPSGGDVPSYITGDDRFKISTGNPTPLSATTTTTRTSTSRPICIPRTAAWSRVPTRRTWAATTGWPTRPSRSSRTKTGRRCISTSAASTRSATCGAAARSTPSPGTAGILRRS